MRITKLAAGALTLFTTLPASAQCPQNTCQVTSVSSTGGAGGGGAATVLISVAAVDGACLVVYDENMQFIECKPKPCGFIIDASVSGTSEDDTVSIGGDKSDPSAGSLGRWSLDLDWDGAGHSGSTVPPPGGPWISPPEVPAPCGLTTTIDFILEVNGTYYPLSDSSATITCSGGCS